MKKKQKSYYELPQADEREMKNHLFKHLAALETISDFFKFLQICRFIAKKQVPHELGLILNNYLFIRNAALDILHESIHLSNYKIKSQHKPFSECADLNSKPLSPHIAINP